MQKKKNLNRQACRRDFLHAWTHYFFYFFPTNFFFHSSHFFDFFAAWSFFFLSFKTIF